MATKVIKIFSALSIVFYILLVFYLVFAIFTIRESEFESSLELGSFVNSVVDSTYSIENSFSTEYFTEKISEVFDTNSKIAGLLLFSEKNGLEYARLTSADYLGNSGAPDFSEESLSPDISPIHPFVRVARTKLFFADGNAVDSIIIFDLMDRSRFFPVLRNTLAGAVLYLILSVVFMSVYSNSKSAVTVKTAVSDDSDSFPAAVPSEDKFESEEEPGPEHIAELPDAAEKPTVNNAAGSGLYSDRSGLVWEHFLPEKLDAELKRAASFDQDSCLVYIRVFSPSGFIPYRNISELIVEHFKYKDLAFEAGDNRFCVIIPEKDLDEGLIDVDKFRSNLIKRFPDSAYRIYAGITSRNSRLLSEKRMIMEAKSALQKAEEEEKSATIAFRTDLNKYREYIATTI